MCKKHWQRWRRWGDPRRVESKWKLSEVDRFWSKVDKSGDCWLWTGGTKNGYGCFYVWDGTTDRCVQAHRYAYELEHGAIPDGMTLDHLCHTAAIERCRDGSACPHRGCVNPAHLEPVSLPDNIRRGGNGTKTHCKRGHEFTPENTGRTSAEGRYCRACARMHAAALRERRRRGTAA